MVYSLEICRESVRLIKSRPHSPGFTRSFLQPLTTCFSSLCVLGALCLEPRRGEEGSSWSVWQCISDKNSFKETLSISTYETYIIDYLGKLGLTKVDFALSGNAHSTGFLLPGLENHWVHQKSISYIAKYGDTFPGQTVHIFPTLLPGPWSLWSYGNRLSAEHRADTQEWTAGRQDGCRGESAETASGGDGKECESPLRGGTPPRVLITVQHF